MRHEKIINYAIEETKTPIHKPGVYTVTVPTKNHKLMWWIRKIIIKLLLKLGIFKDYYEDSTSFKRVVIDKQEVFGLIREHLDNILYRGENPTMAILGYEAMRKLDVEIYKNMRFTMELPPYKRDNQKPEIMGLEVVLSPYINGIVVI